MELANAMRLSPDTRLALVGAGGKTTALFQLARQLSPPVFITATTHLATEQLHLVDHHFVIKNSEDTAALEVNLPQGVILFTGETAGTVRAQGVEEATLKRILRLADARCSPLLIEADSAQMRPLKAPAAHEPAIPDFVNTVVVVAGLRGLGKPLSPEWVHRPERFGAISGVGPGETITQNALVNVLTSPAGALKNIPPDARRIMLLNQADTSAIQAQAHGMVVQLQDKFHAVIVASLDVSNHTRSVARVPPGGNVIAVNEWVAGVILAAGDARRMGQPKQLLEWRGKPLIRHVAEMALEAGLSSVIVVTGAYANEVEAALEGLPLILVHNQNWEAGQSTSVKRGLDVVRSEVGGVVFILADQPQVPATLIRALCETHAATLAPIVAPQIDGQRGNPVLFDRATFSDFETLTGDQGGRPLFAHYQVTWIPWHDSRPLADVDTFEDYQRLLKEGEY